MWLASRINWCNFCEKFPICNAEPILSFQAFVATGFNLILNYDTSTNFNPAHRQSDFDREPGKVSGDLNFCILFLSNSFQHLYLVRANTPSHEILNKRGNWTFSKENPKLCCPDRDGWERAALFCSPSNIQKLLKTHPPLNNPLWVASDTTMCNMSGFNSYPGTPLTPGGNRVSCHLHLSWHWVPLAPDGSCDHCVLVTTLVLGPRGPAAVLTSVYAVYTARACYWWIMP